MPRKKKQARRGYGSGSITWRKDGRADIRWYENGIQKRKKGVPHEYAEKVLAEITANIEAGKSGLVSFNRTYKTVNEYATRWFDLRTTDANVPDLARYNLHLRPIVGHLPPSAVSTSLIRDEIIRRKLKEGLAPATVHNMVAILSSMFSNMAEDGIVEFNPFKNLSKQTRQMLRSDYDIKGAPWVKDQEMIPQIITQLKEPLNYVYAVGVMAGLRTGEIRGLDWAAIEWARKRIVVRQQVSQREHRIKECKDDDSRIVPILPELEPMLREWWEKNGRPKSGLVFGPMTPGHRVQAADKRVWMAEFLLAGKRGQKLPSLKDCNVAIKARFGSGLDYADFMRLRREALGADKAPKPAEGNGVQQFIGVHSIGQEWHRVRESLGLPEMRFYDATRHTFGSQWISRGGSVEELRDLLGHSDLQTTERYVHMSRTFAGESRDLFGMTPDTVRQAIRDKNLGLLWKIEGRPEPTPRTEDDDIEEAI